MSVRRDNLVNPWRVLFQTSVTVFSMLQSNCEESYCPYIISVNGDQNRVYVFRCSGEKHFLFFHGRKNIINVRNKDLYF